MSAPTGAAIGDDDVTIDVEAIELVVSSAVGRVVKTGERSVPLLGRRVLVGPIDPCGDCEVCRRGGAAVCPDSRRRRDRASSIIVRGRWVVPLGDGLELAGPGAAAVAGSVAIAYTLYARTGLGARDPVVVLGTTPVTRFLVEILLAKGITPTVVVDAAAEPWTAWLIGKGARLAAISADASDNQAREAVTDAISALGIGARPWRLITTDPAAVTRAAALAGPRATLTVLSPPDAPISKLPGDLMSREVTVIGVAAAHPDLVVEVAAMCVKGEIDLVGGTSTSTTTTADSLARAIVTVP